MGFLSKFFGVKKPKAVAFVDYEHWYISMEKLYRMKPDIQAWVDILSERAEITEIYFFADFSNDSLKREIPKIRAVTNRIIETSNSNPRVKKDFTDFIMLDHIYQRALSDDDTELFVIFTGDGHFSSVSAFLKTIRKKQVGIYGIRGAFSNQLKASASWSVELPDENALSVSYVDMVLQNIYSVHKSGKVKVTFRNTVSAVSEKNNISPEIIQKTLQSLVDKNYIKIVSERAYNRNLKVMNVDWKKLERDGYWKGNYGKNR